MSSKSPTWSPYLTLDNVEESAGKIRKMLADRTFASVGSSSVSNGLSLDPNDPSKSVTVEYGKYNDGEDFAVIQIRATRNQSWRLVAVDGRRAKQLLHISAKEQTIRFSQETTSGSSEGSVFETNVTKYVALVAYMSIDSKESQAPEGVKGE